MAHTGPQFFKPLPDEHSLRRLSLLLRCVCAPRLSLVSLSSSLVTPSSYSVDISVSLSKHGPFLPEAHDMTSVWVTMTKPRNSDQKEIRDAIRSQRRISSDWQLICSEERHSVFPSVLFSPARKGRTGCTSACLVSPSERIL